MEFHLELNDGFAQIGVLNIDKHTIKTPNLIFPIIDKIPFLEKTEIFISENKKITNKPNIFFFYEDENKSELRINNKFVYPKDIPLEIHIKQQSNNKFKENSCNVLPGNKDVINTPLKKINNSLFIISNALQLFKNPKEFVSYISIALENKKPNHLFYLPSVTKPENISLLMYMGIDIFDTYQAIISARNNTFLFFDGKKHISQLKEIQCNCPSCREIDNINSFEFNDILYHNYFMMINELKTVKNAIYSDSIRELVSKRITSSPHLTSILRFFENESYNLIEAKTPIHRKTQLKATSIDSLNRPEIKRFQNRIITRYKKPDSTSILLLLPCSAKKPYSFSKSHKKFIQTIQSVTNHYAIHEMIITSPLGLVPRELELIYPASSYDIPVTGIWYDDEKQMILDLIKKYLEINNYQKIIIHLSSPLNSFLKEKIPNSISTNICESAATHSSLKKLKETLEMEIKGFEAISGKTRFKENMFSLLSYQFSKKIAKELLKNVNIKGKYPYLKIFDLKNEQLGMLTENRGFISLTLQGGKKIEELKKYYVEISDDFDLKGSVFSPGVIDADSVIRKGDEVIVLQNNQLKGVGVAKMNGQEMIQRQYGKAVNIRHKTD